MDTKALKKQMGAAIAMVLVAAVALGSATFAWFVSNNKVEAKTASVSAQSNAPFLKIGLPSDKELTKTEVTQTAGEGDKVELYPSQWNHVVAPETYQFESAYASAATAWNMLDGSRFAVGDVDNAHRPDYALKQSFKIGTTDEKAGSFQNLKVASVTVNASEGSDGLKSAICVLVKCGNQWGVYRETTDGTELTAYGDGTPIVNNLTGKDGTNVGDALAAEIGAKKTVDVDVYVFYDGSASTVFSDNLASLKNCGVTVAFTATPVNTDGNAVNVG
ncbi:MAG: hypothetical protein EGR35_09940 [Collinsella aerofaciens]|nr:hypothetical protein [Collinsella aerofaciens]